ncbi:hypothetical protein KP509_37G007200 [Ceratopteris richardii]|uniref:Phospholipid-transporting ATPase n=5 Tax=Ceratopteris richardii TaxID=49495 RepID=A0A8T2Q662_CERRI|nr:hypothetical protein KP509_37G007200 [Ceratopteris richardii]
MARWRSASYKARERINQRYAPHNDLLHHRTIYCNDLEKNKQFSFKGNSISTTKYNVLTFLPKGLFEQFRRVANLYFLMISILSATPVSPVNPITNAVPLVLVISVSLIKEAYEDWKRFFNDKTINSTMVDVLRDGHWRKLPWRRLVVGDIVKVHKDSFFPADLLFLASTNQDGVCYVETSNLDGETNLKIRKALERTWDYVDEERAKEFQGEIQCEQPNNSLYTFTGNLIIGKQTLPVTPNQLLLRGCSLRNTEFIVGVAVFTGHETKVMMNAMNVPSKRSTLERRLDMLILILFSILFIMCFIDSICSGIFINRKYWYLGLTSDVEDQFNPGNRFLVACLTFLTFVTLFSPIIPISLYVSIEMIKVFQVTQFINKDVKMYHKETNTPALARTSNLNEELGQVEYIFSDKTGTLTRNLMEFFKCSIGGVIYGKGVTEIEKAAARRNGTGIEEMESPAESHEKYFNFDDDRLMRGAWRNEPNPELCKEFFRCLAVCHTVLPEGDELPEKIVYQAASPDEAALVTAAKMFGFFFFRRTPTSIRVRESHVEKIGRMQDVEYEILNVLEFNSTRKRQSVICRYPNGRLVLYCKGADSVIYERLMERHNPFKDTNRDHLEYFGAAGLRTLCLAYRDLDINAYEMWNEKFVQAKSALRDREKKLDEVAELIEKDLILIGSTAIEDKLQEGVPVCIETLAKGGIKIWVLTGDKLETAINIAYACSLMNNGMKQFIINSDTKEIRDVEDRGDALETAQVIERYVAERLNESLRQAVESEQTQTGLELALVIDGRCLMYALDPELRGTLLKLSVMCKAVVCCRVSPLQKAQVTSMIKDGAKKITLSIGDGANDVSMIQAAHIGVGISGLEGMQAVMASDFAIAQFRFLTDLLLVHGRLSYLRISKVVAYFFYKNLMFTLTQFWFNLYTGFSGQRFYDDWFQSLYNVVFTALPVIIVGIFDKDVSITNSRKYPQLYKAGIENIFFRWRILIIWAISAVYQSVILFFFPIKAIEEGKNSSGRMLGLWDAGTMAFTCVVVTVNLRLFLACNFITRWHLISIFGSILAWFIFAFFYSGFRNPLDKQGNIYQVIFVIMGTWYFWYAIVLVPVASLALDFLHEGMRRWFAPYDYHIIQEEEKIKGVERDELLLVESPRQAPEQSLELTGLHGEMSKHTGYSFDSPCFDSFFASQEGVSMSQRSYDIARRASMRVSRRQSSDLGSDSPPPGHNSLI